MSKDYETYEANISALIDGELSREEIMLTIDKIASDEKCREFYKEARKLQNQVDGEIFNTEREILPDFIWENIEKETGAKKARVFKLKPFPVQTFAAAAVVLLIVGWFTGSWFAPLRDGWRDKPLEINLAEASGSMSEERFMELTAEILRADHRYHRKMYEVMSAVNNSVYGNEGMDEPSEYRRRPADTNDAVDQTDDSARNTGRGGNPLEISFW